VSAIKPEKKERKNKVIYNAQQRTLTEKLGDTAKIIGQKIVITFHSEEELNTIISRIH
jgi:hypothetical protein